jgi:hypothetical protein
MRVDLTPEQERAFEEADIRLCGGIFSGGSGSFRGKVYSVLIYEISGESLARDWIPPTTVEKIYQALMDCDPEEVMEKCAGPLQSPEEIHELRRFFKICVDHGLGLIGWY